MVLAKIGGFLLGLDSFGQSIGLQIKGGSAYNTYIGSFVTTLCYIVTISYAYYMGSQLITFGNSQLAQINKHNFYS
jgi:hypothetical protein